MAKVIQWQAAFADGTVAFARTTQAAALATLEAILPPGRSLAPRGVWPRVARPGDLIDGGYDLLARLVDLHREFAQRLLDVVDDDRHVAGDAGASDASRPPLRKSRSRR